MSSSFITKTRAQAAAFREKRGVAIVEYSGQLETYAKTYMVSFDGSESLSDWSSRHAKRFSTTVNGYIPLAVIARDLEEYVSKNKRSATVKSTRLMVTRYHNSHPFDEWAEGRSQFNKFLYSEFETWYAAFEAEADEDYEVDAASAASRWIYQCANKLRARTGLSVETLVPVVEAWLNEHKA
jgi:hypothetical protein